MASPPPLETEYENSRELYNALMRGEKEKVLELCQNISDGPFHVVTVHKDMVLHVAAFTKQADLVLKLLERVSDDQLNKLTLQNEIGNTILHAASISNKLVKAAEEMLSKAPELFNMRNNLEITPLFRSVVFGRMKMFKFLDETYRKQKQTTDHTGDLDGFYYHSSSKTTVLHRAVTNGSFELALFIAKSYKHFVDKQDEDGMTALQLLVCNSSAFKIRRGFKRRCGGGYLEHLMCSLGCWRVPCWEAIQEERETYEWAMKLAKFLIKEDRSWIETKKVENGDAPKYHLYESQDSSEKKENEKKPVPSTVIALTPLFLAIKHGCFEIVKEILKVHPWAVEHVDYQGRTILHVAIKYRQLEVLEHVEQMGLMVKRLERKLDKKSNTILHMVGEKVDDRIVPELRSPAFELQDNLVWYERVWGKCPNSIKMTLNLDKKTAQKLFDEGNEELRGKAKEWLQHTAENCSIVAVLIATVAFAAAYTVPGGNQSTGVPILLHRPFFVVFTLTDVLSLTFSLTSVIFFLRIHTSSFPLKDFKRSLPQTLLLGVTLLILSVSMMMFAFAATVILMINNREHWTKVALYTASFFPVTIFALSYLPLYLSLMKTFDYSIKKVANIFPRFTCYPFKSEPKPIETSSSANPQKPRASADHVSV